MVATGEDPAVEAPPATQDETPQEPGYYDTIKPIDPDANANTRSVSEALRTGEHPERVSVWIKPKPFDKEAFAADPQAYLDLVEPGRVWQTAQPGQGVPVLRPIGQSFQQIEQGEKTLLKVRAPAKAPVTFMSFDLGAFENQLTCITVQADSQGIAQAEFYASPGTIADCNILAACPLATEQVKFVVHITPARTASTQEGHQ